jgi:signal transduction histidine kinase
MHPQLVTSDRNAMKSSYPRNISLISIVFILLIIFLALVNLYISMQFRQEFIRYDQEKIRTIAALCSDHFRRYDNRTTLYSVLKNTKSAFELEHMVIADTLGYRVYDSWKLPLELSLSHSRVNFSADFQRLPSPGEILRKRNVYLYYNEEPPFYLYVSLLASEVFTFDSLFRWHIVYITISLLFIGFLGIFLIRNLFMPMRYVSSVAQDMGIEMKKEDFVSTTFNEIFKTIKRKEETLVEFSAYIAHEFRNSIGAIIGLARLVEKGKKPASAIAEECQAMTELIAKLLDYSKPLKAISGSVDVPRLLDDALQKAAIPDRINVTKEGVDAVPTFIGDYELLVAALTNLFKNSVEAIEGEGSIDVNVSHDADSIVITITDSGAGIDEEEFERIFSPFHTQKADGMGLGLAYVKKIMELHNGRISVASKKGKGSTFTLYFPLKQKP